ncbi:MAG: hypothetical protein HC780_11940 [Leptolyngbyaceae cyanobacterium CSU_1_3]|nr:hypothetical protein [Leptolyngbyaceae cyanobacterium CSU_1_3]
MNSSGRIVGGLLIGIATLWILGIAGVFPFNNRPANQVATNADRTPVSDANARRPVNQANQNARGATTALNAQGQPTTSAQADNTNTPGTSTTPTNADGSTRFDSSNLNSDTTQTGATPQTTPPLRAGW